MIHWYGLGSGAAGRSAAAGSRCRAGRFFKGGVPATAREQITKDPRRSGVWGPVARGLKHASETSQISRRTPEFASVTSEFASMTSEFARMTSGACGGRAWSLPARPRKCA